jgi:hypothetical protein
VLEKISPKLLGKYPGEWLVIYKNKIIAHHRDLRMIKDKINGCKGVPTLFKLPKDNIIFLPDFAPNQKFWRRLPSNSLHNLP